MQRQKRHVLSVATLKRLFVPWPRRLPAAANCNDPLSDNPLSDNPLRGNPLRRNGKPA